MDSVVSNRYSEFLDDVNENVLVKTYQTGGFLTFDTEELNSKNSLTESKSPHVKQQNINTETSMLDTTKKGKTQILQQKYMISSHSKKRK